MNRWLDPQKLHQKNLYDTLLVVVFAELLIHPNAEAAKLTRFVSENMAYLRSAYVFLA